MTNFLQVTGFDPLIISEPQGPAGPQGQQGIQGPVGPAGGVNSIDGKQGDVSLSGSYVAPAGKTSTGAASPLTYLNVVDYGAVAGNDCTAAIQAAINALPSEGGIIVFPPSGSAYGFTNLNINGKASVTFEGAGTRTAGAAATSRLVCTATDASSGINAQGAFGFTIRNLQITYSSTTYTGRIVDLRNGATLATLENVSINNAGQGTSTATGVSVSGSHTIRLDGCHIAGCAIGLLGREGLSDSAANSITAHNTEFTANATANMKNAGDNWAFQGCTFEQLTNGTAGALASDPNTSIVVSGAVVFVGCWFGDVTAPGGTQITVCAHSLVLLGCSVGFGGGSTAGTFQMMKALYNSGAGFGLTILGNHFSGATGAGQSSYLIDVSAISAASVQILLAGNTYTSLTSRYAGGGGAGAMAAGWVDLDTDIARVQGLTFGSPTLRDTISMVGGSVFSTGTGTGTKFGSAATDKMAFWGTTPVARPVLNYSRSGAGETAAAAALRTALTTAGLVTDSTTA